MLMYAMDDNLRQRKNELFRELKPHCVKLSQLALKGDGGTAITKDLIDTTKKLQEILHDRCEANDAFDDNLANYVFFPLQHILRLCQKRTGQLAELATKCLRELLEHGWRTIAIQLGHQLLLLLTFFAGGGPSTTHVSEELQEEAYRALGALFKIIHNTPKGAASLVEAANIPALGQCLSVILDGITGGPSSQIQLAALTALHSLWLCIKDRQAQSSFLPGTVSALTKCLTPTIKSPRSRMVLVSTLQIFQNIITTTLSDLATRSIKDDSGQPGIESSSSLSRSWLTATATQIRLALANIIKLRSHNHQEVRKALETVCLTILDECHYSLAESAPLLVETALSIVTSSGADEDLFRQGRSLKGLAVVYPSISELIKNTAYKWVTSLPRIMQGNDEWAKQSTLSQISKVQGVFSDIGQDSTVLNDSLFESLRNSIVSILGTSPFRKGVNEMKMAVSSNSISPLSSVEHTANHYRPILMPHGSQTQTREQLDLLVSNIGPPEIRIDMARRLLEYIRNSAGIDMLSALWLSLNLLRSRTSMELDSLILKRETISDEMEAVFSELYAYAVSNLSDPEEIDTDWRIQAVSLEIVTYAASIWGDAFQLDLADTLYPIVHLLGSPNAELKEHAITSLNTISRSSGYSSTSNMIVSNVDYLVNVIALKLNTFDISPQAPQVLVMMMSLSGPSILPYLDDVVGSIFAALDNFHGYPKLVESLFNVLGEVVEQGRVSRLLQVLENPPKSHRKQKAIGPRIEDVLTIVRANTKKVSATRIALNETSPAEPWKGAGTQLDELETSNSLEEDTSTSPQGFEIDKPATTKLYTMVQNIARLSQHYLTNQSPHLRARLLNLIYSAYEVLHMDENQYLPLVNDIWPVLIQRLYDDEPFVIIAASRAVEETCIRAGDFMSTRIEVEWHDILRHAQNAKTKAAGEKKGNHGRGHHSQNWQVWEAFIKLLTTIVEYVRIKDDMFDEALEVLADIVGNREDVHNSFSSVNADAVWLLQLQQGRLAPIKAPVTTDIRFIDVCGQST